MNDILEELLEAWRTNNRISLFLIDTIEAAGMQATLSTRGGRTVARQFAHTHNNRIYHLEGRARDLSKGLRKFETAEEPGPERLADAFRLSSERFEAFIERGVTGTGRCRTSRKGSSPT